MGCGGAFAAVAVASISRLVQALPQRQCKLGSEPLGTRSGESHAQCDRGNRGRPRPHHLRTLGPHEIIAWTGLSL